MPSERVQRRIDKLLDEAEAAADVNDWPTMLARAESVLDVDADNEDATGFVAIARRNLGADTGPAAGQEPAGPVAEEPAPALPSAFVSGRYEVQALLGEGARKVVYRAHDTRLDRDVAFALIKTAGLDADGRARIQREAAALGRLGGHPHIVTVFDVGEDEAQQPFIVSEYMAGGAVEDVIDAAEEGRLPIAEAVDIGIATAKALQHAHAQGLVHRDCKPANLWRTDDGTVKLGDFGLALAPAETRMTTEGTVLGTVAYMAPEQALGRETGPPADLYALGCVLYECLTGHPPFAGDDVVAVISQHLNTAPVAPTWHRADCPAALETLILQLLEKDAAQRPASAEAVATALAAIDLSALVAETAHANPLDRLAHGVFVGREGELDKLRGAFDDARSGRGGLVMLVGEPGIGKTRTTQELETWARMHGAQVLWGRAYEEAGAPPYWPWVQIGRSWGTAVGPERVSRVTGAGELGRIFPEAVPEGAAPPEPSADPATAQFRLFDAYVRLLTSVAEDAPLLVVLDDLHWADKPSLLLLQHIARELAHLPILIVATYRDTDLVRTHSLSESLAALNRDPGFTRIPLRGLSGDEIAQYIRTAAHVDPDRALLARIVEETEGNPFFLAEVVNLLTAEGRLERGHSAEFAVPDGVREALGRRLDRLSEEANALLATAAVVGREFPYDTLTALEAHDADTLLGLIEEGIEARVIEEMERPGRYRFTHALMQETLLGELSTTRRIRLHGRIGEALERRWGDRAEERATRLAGHFVESATLTPEHAKRAVRYSLLAAEQAEAQSAWRTAMQHYDATATLLSDNNLDAGANEAEVLWRLGRAAATENDGRIGWRAYMRAIDLYRAAGTGVDAAKVAFDSVTSILVRPERAAHVLGEALAGLGDRDEALRARLLSAFVLWGPPFDAGREGAVREAREIAERHQLPEVQGLLLVGEQEQRRLFEGDGADADRYREARDLLATVKMDELGERLSAQSCWVALETGRLDGGEADRVAKLEWATRQRDPLFREALLSIPARVAFARGDLASMESQSAAMTDDGNRWMQVRSALLDARGESEAAMDWVMPQGFGGALQNELPIRGERVRLLSNAGAHGETAREFREMRAYMATQLPPPHAAWWELALLDEALERLGGQAFLRSARACLNAALDPPRPIIYHTNAGRSLIRIAADLELALGNLDAAERRYAEARVWAEREGARMELGRIEHGMARLRLAEGRSEEAAQHCTKAIELFDDIGARLYLDRAVALRMELQGLVGADPTSSIDAVAASITHERPNLAPQAAPDGTVTLLFSDIEGSTTLNARLGDRAFFALLQEHNAIVRSHLQANRGFEVKNEGDGFMLAFKSAVDGLRCAIGVQRALAERNDTAEEPIRVRIGLHTGEAIRDQDDFFGLHVNLAARVGSAAAGGEILVSALLKELAAHAGEFRFDDGRDVELKGIGPQRVHRVEWS